MSADTDQASQSASVVLSLKDLFGLLRDTLFFFLVLFYLMGFTYYVSYSATWGVELSLVDIPPLQFFAYMYHVFVKNVNNEAAQVLYVFVGLILSRCVLSIASSSEQRGPTWIVGFSRWIISCARTWGTIFLLAAALVLLTYNLWQAWFTALDDVKNQDEVRVIFKEAARRDQDAFIQDQKQSKTYLFGETTAYFEIVLVRRGSFPNSRIYLLNKKDVASIDQDPVDLFPSSGRL